MVIRTAVLRRISNTGETYTLHIIRCVSFFADWYWKGYVVNGSNERDMRHEDELFLFGSKEYIAYISTL